MLNKRFCTGLMTVMIMICPVCNWDTDIKSCNLHEKDFLKQISKPFTPRLQLNKHAKKAPQGGVVESYQLPDSP